MGLSGTLQAGVMGPVAGSSHHDGVTILTLLQHAMTCCDLGFQAIGLRGRVFRDRSKVPLATAQKPGSIYRTVAVDAGA